MTSTDKELEVQLTEAGNKLVTPPASVEELLPLLDHVENCLSKVEQSPAKSMQNALAPSLQALVADELFRHSDIDVKVSVASCISEITRITAPDAPYDDDRMKDVFQLIVSSFEHLADSSSRSYGKRTSILETVAKVRSCVVMLDLECDGLIVEMFQHFLKAIREYHPDSVFSSMETIMTLVLEESEDISIELLSPLLESVKKGYEEVPPFAQKLGEKVLESSATKVKPYLIDAVKSLNISLNDYSEVVSSLCKVATSNAEENDAHLADDNKAEEEVTTEASSPKPAEEGKLDQETLDEAVEADKEVTTEASSPKPAELADDTSLKSAVSNGIVQTAEDDSLTDSTSLKKQEDANHTDQAKSIETSNNDAQCIVDTEKLVNVESSKLDISVKQKGRKLNSSVKLAEPSESSHMDVEEKADELSDDKNHEREVPPPPFEELGAPSENQKESDSKPSSPKGLVNESMTVASPSASDQSLSKEAGQSKKKDDLVRDSAPSADVVPKKTSGGTSDSAAKLNKRSSRKASDRTKEDKTPLTIDESKKEGDTTSASDGKQLKQSFKKVDGKSKDGDGSPTKKPEDKKRQSRGKAISEKNVAKSSTKDDIKEKPPSLKSATKSSTDAEEIPMTSNKRKRSSLGKEKASEDGDELVGAKIKVWWPLDRKFYEGVIESFDAVKVEHKVLYTDGETENLDLGVETWEFVKTDPKADEIEAADYPSPTSSSDMPLKKVKSNISQLAKQGKKDASPKRGGSASSKRARSAAAKNGRNTKEVDDSKSGKKVEDKSGAKAKDQASKSGAKSGGTATKASSKSKTDDAVTSKTSKSKEDAVDTPKGSKSKQETPKSGKSKVETPKTSPCVKGKAPKSGGRSNINSTGKLKSGPSKAKEAEDKDSSTESDELAESTKKRASSSKGQASAVRSGKKRRRT